MFVMGNPNLVLSVNNPDKNICPKNPTLMILKEQSTNSPGNRCYSNSSEFCLAYTGSSKVKVINATTMFLGPAIVCENQNFKTPDGTEYTNQCDAFVKAVKAQSTFLFKYQDVNNKDYTLPENKYDCVTADSSGNFLIYLEVPEINEPGGSVQKFGMSFRYGFQFVINDNFNPGWCDNTTDVFYSNTRCYSKGEKWGSGDDIYCYKGLDENSYSDQYKNVDKNDNLRIDKDEAENASLILSGADCENISPNPGSGS